MTDIKYSKEKKVQHHLDNFSEYNNCAHQG